MVVVNLYQFEKVAAQRGCRGRGADREHRHRRADADPRGGEELPGCGRGCFAGRLRGDPERDARKRRLWRWPRAGTWRRRRSRLTADYDRAISARLARIELDDGGFEDRGSGPAASARHARRTGAAAALRREPAPVRGALFATGRGGVAAGEQLQGKELSYNNLVDLDAAWQLALEFDAPASAIIKHTNPCGCAEDASQAESYRKAFEADPVSAYGGVLAFNRELDAETALEIAKTFIEAIAAPALFEPGAGDPRGEEEPAAGARPPVHARSTW